MTQQQALAAKSDAFTPKQIGTAKGVINGAVSRALGANGLGERIPKALTGSKEDKTKLVSEVLRMIGDLLSESLDRYEAKLKTATAAAGTGKADAAASMAAVASARDNFAVSTTPKFMSLSTMSAYHWFCWAFYQAMPDRDGLVTAYLNRNRRQLRAELSKVAKPLLAFMERSPWMPAGHPSDSKPAKAATPTKSPRSRKAPEKAPVKAPTRTTRAAPRSI